MAKTLATSTATSRQPLLGDASTSGRSVRFLPKAFGACCVVERSGGRSDAERHSEGEELRGDEKCNRLFCRRLHTPGADHRAVHRAGSEDGSRWEARTREGRLLPRRVRMNLNEPPGSVFWPMTLRPVQLYVHSRETYATRRYQEVTHRRRYRRDESCPSSSPTPDDQELWWV